MFTQVNSGMGILFNTYICTYVCISIYLDLYLLAAGGLCALDDAVLFHVNVSLVAVHLEDNGGAAGHKAGFIDRNRAALKGHDCDRIVLNPVDTARLPYNLS